MDWELFVPTALLAMVVVGIVLVASARRSTSARPWLLLAAASVAAMPVGIVLHNLASAVLGVEEAVFFVVALVLAPVGFAVGTLASGVALLRSGAQSVGASLVAAGAGMALFGLYALVALVATSLAGENLPWQRAIEPVVLPASLLLLVGGALVGLISMLRQERTTLTAPRGS